MKNTRTDQRWPFEHSQVAVIQLAKLNGPEQPFG
jgi:hypothetical protein